MLRGLFSSQAATVREQELELQIVDLAEDGRGIGRLAGKAVFVRGALPGETVRARVRRRSKYDEGEVLQVLQPSPDRVLPGCAHFEACSGCSLQHLAADAQIRFKQAQLAAAFERIGRVTPERWLAPLVAEPWAYRHKARLSVRHVEKKNRTLVGFREQQAGFVADLAQCTVLDARLGPRLAELGEWLGRLQARREIAQLEVSFGETGWCMVVRHMAPLGQADRSVLVALAQHFGCALWLQSGGPEQLEALHGTEQPLHYALPEFAVEIGFRPMDFIQVNPAINRAMVGQALALLQPAPGECILDLYCGLGNFTLPIARSGAYVSGVEGDPGLTARATENARRNGLGERVDFHAADLALPQGNAAWASTDYDKILLDPPRAGAEAVLRYLPGKSVRRVVYVSCHPGTLARDAGVLVREHGFVLAAAGAMDMFPHTAHVESMALFERRGQ